MLVGSLGFDEKSAAAQNKIMFTVRRENIHDHEEMNLSHQLLGIDWRI